VYDKIQFKKINKLDYKVFHQAYYGYLNLKEAGKVHGNAPLIVCDFSLSSNKKRMWIIDLQKKKILWNNLVAHGRGSGEDFATRFSNIHESHQSSLGFFTTGELYMGENGLSCKLHGQDGNFNNNAFDRAVVMHGSDYVSDQYAKANNRIGRSFGCPAIPREITEAVLKKIANGSVLFIYHPTRNYLNSSYWLNNRIGHLPQEANFLDLIRPELNIPAVADKSARPSDTLINRRIVNKQNILIDSIENEVVDIVPLAEPEQLPAPNIVTNSQKNSRVVSKQVSTSISEPKREKEFLYIRY
jgi:hypothetical protein